MKTFRLLMLLMLMAGLVATLPVYAAEQNDMHHHMNSSTEMRSSNNMSNMSMSEHMALNTNDLIGRTVKDRNNNTLGTVENLLISRDGRVDFVVLAESGKMGTVGPASKYVPIPFQTLMSQNNISNTNSDKDLIASFDKTKLDSAPGFKDKKFELSRKDQQCKIYSFYGVGASHGC